MKATIERATLLRCLSHVQSVVERRNTIPILSNVLIDADEGGGVKVMATDLDLQVVAQASQDHGGVLPWEGRDAVPGGFDVQPGGDSLHGFSIPLPVVPPLPCKRT
mgnify:CR=1 FL=1